MYLKFLIFMSLISLSAYAAEEKIRKPAALETTCGFVNGIKYDDQSVNRQVDFKVEDANSHAIYYIQAPDDAGLMGMMITQAAFSQTRVCLTTRPFERGTGSVIIGLYINKP